jgi:hypothetical protein
MKHHLRCTTCGKTGPLPPTMHLGGGASVGKRIMGKCSGCGGAMRSLAVVPIPDGHENDAVWNELLAYIVEETMSVDTALAIIGSAGSSDRKREVAAHVAEGSLKPEDGLKMLQVK